MQVCAFWVSTSYGFREVYNYLIRLTILHVLVCSEGKREKQKGIEECAMTECAISAANEST